VAILEAGLARYAEVIERELGLALGDVPGSGASGGLGAGLVAFLGAELVSSVTLVSSVLAIEEEMARADLAVTGEGRMDAQTLMDKVPYYVAQLGLSLGVPVAAIAGSLGPDASILYEHGIVAMISIIPHPCTLEDAFANAENWTTEAAERLGRRCYCNGELSLNCNGLYRQKEKGW
jgi:glycerate kinase